MDSGVLLWYNILLFMELHSLFSYMGIFMFFLALELYT